MICATCTHPRQIHLGSGCRINGCPCDGFSDVPRGTKAAGPRRVSIDVPDGYALQIMLTPWDLALASETAGAEAIAGVTEEPVS